MQEADVLALQATVAWAAFGLSFVLGAVMNRSGFCTMGALSDILNMGDWTRMRMWLCAIGVAVLGAQALALAGLVDLGKSIYTAPRLSWLSNLAGGFLFGFGMVLASGCGSKTLVRIGGGSLKAVVVFLVLGLTAYMTLRGLFGVWRASFLDPVAIQLSTAQDLPTLLGAGDANTVRTLRLVLGGGIGLALVAFALAGREFRSLDNLLGGIGVGLVVAGAWYVSGHLGFVAEDPRTLEEAFVATNSGRLEAISFVAPVAYTLELLMFWSDASRIVTIGIASVVGVIAGSFAWALASRSFRWEGFAGPEDTANHLVGGALMGIGGVIALGCTIGQGLSGLSTLAIGSFIAFAAILAGGVAGVRYQAWRVERMV
nr:YeeE/YedE family protein [Quisquiliibacterium transsilvanicum]